MKKTTSKTKSSSTTKSKTKKSKKSSTKHDSTNTNGWDATRWMYVILILLLIVTVILCIRGLMDYGFTLDSIPNFILVIVLLIMSIVIVFAITTLKKAFILPLSTMIKALALLTAAVVCYRIYVFTRDRVEVLNFISSIITYAFIFAFYALAYFVIEAWKKEIKRRK